MTARRLSEHPTFRSNQDWYHQAGPAAWGEARVPSFAASNGRSARSTAQVIAAFVAELGEPVTVVEIGCGSGRFGFLLARELEALLPEGGYALLLTDAAASLVDAVQAHPAFTRLSHPDRVTARTLDAGDVGRLPDGPLVLVANYVLDSLPQDVFTKVQGALHEVHYDDHGAPSVVPRRGYPEEPELDAIVDARARALPGDGPFTVPVASLRLLQAAAHGRPAMLAILADRGWVDDAEIPRLSPVFDHHDGAVSLMVDLRAIGAWGERRGWAVVPESRAAHVDWVVVGFGVPERGPAHRAAVRLFDETSPMEVVYPLMAHAMAAVPTHPRMAIAALRLLCFDPEALELLADALSAPFPDDMGHADGIVVRLVMASLERSYLVPGRQPSALAAARVLRARGRPELAEAALIDALADGAAPSQLWKEVARCRLVQGAAQGALQALERALQEDPFDDEARALRHRLLAAPPAGTP